MNYALYPKILLCEACLMHVFSHREGHLKHIAVTPHQNVADQVGGDDSRYRLLRSQNQFGIGQIEISPKSRESSAMVATSNPLTLVTFIGSASSRVSNTFRRESGVSSARPPIGFRPVSHDALRLLPFAPIKRLALSVFPAEYGIKRASPKHREAGPHCEKLSSTD